MCFELSQTTFQENHVLLCLNHTFREYSNTNKYQYTYIQYVTLKWEQWNTLKRIEVTKKIFL